MAGIDKPESYFDSIHRRRNQSDSFKSNPYYSDSMEYRQARWSQAVAEVGGNLVNLDSTATSHKTRDLALFDLAIDGRYLEVSIYLQSISLKLKSCIVSSAHWQRKY